MMMIIPNENNDMKVQKYRSIRLEQVSRVSASDQSLKNYKEKEAKRSELTEFKWKICWNCLKHFGWKECDADGDDEEDDVHNYGM